MRLTNTIFLSIAILLSLITFVYANDPPTQIKILDEIILREGIKLSINLSEYYTDPDGDNLTYSIVKEGNVTIVITKDEMLITPKTDFQGITTIRLRISDTNVTITDEITFFVLNDNPPPTTTNNTTEETNSTEQNYIIPNQNNSTPNTTEDKTKFNKTILIVSFISITVLILVIIIATILYLKKKENDSKIYES
jgi:hypothetical protein